jgi:hypothetical protein
VILLGTHRADIVSMLDQVLLESLVFLRDGVLPDVGQESQCNKTTEDAERAGDVEWILTLLDNVVSGCRDDVGEDVVANEGSDLSARCCNAVVPRSWSATCPFWKYSWAVPQIG